MACLEVEGAVFEHLLKKKKVEQHGDDENSDDSEDSGDSSDKDESDKDENDEDENDEDENDENDNGENILDQAEMPSSSSSTSITSSIEISPPTANDEKEIEKDNLYVKEYELVRIEGRRKFSSAILSPKITKNT